MISRNVIFISLSAWCLTAMGVSGQVGPKDQYLKLQWADSTSSNTPFLGTSSFDPNVPHIEELTIVFRDDQSAIWIYELASQVSFGQFRISKRNLENLFIRLNRMDLASKDSPGLVVGGYFQISFGSDLQKARSVRFNYPKVPSANDLEKLIFSDGAGMEPVCEGCLSSGLYSKATKLYSLMPRQIGKPDISSTKPPKE